MPFVASQMTEFLFCPYSVSPCLSEPARTGTCITSISCTCSSLVMYICCRESSSSLFLSSRVFPSSAARWRSRKKAEMRQTNDQSVLHFVSAWNSNYRGSRARRRERRNSSPLLFAERIWRSGASTAPPRRGWKEVEYEMESDWRRHINTSNLFCIIK